MFGQNQNQYQHQSKVRMKFQTTDDKLFDFEEQAEKHQRHIDVYRPIMIGFSIVLMVLGAVLFTMSDISFKIPEPDKKEGAKNAGKIHLHRQSGD